MVIVHKTFTADHQYQPVVIRKYVIIPSHGHNTSLTQHSFYTQIELRVTSRNTKPKDMNN